ncbi:MAG: hypothetical protein HUJ16_09460 [Kangiella sp.]|nr:hypothetical protein [Kangiella sp.]
MHFIKNIFFLMILFSLSGCITSPSSLTLKPVDNSIQLDEPSNSIITSVTTKETREKLNLPNQQKLFRAERYIYPPSSINGVDSYEFAAKFAGMLVDGNFKVAVNPGDITVGFDHKDGSLTREYLIMFNAKPKNRYFASFITVHSNYGRYSIKPIVYNETTQQYVEYKFISDLKK